jgi:hypothetical protein
MGSFIIGTLLYGLLEDGRRKSEVREKNHFRSSDF